MRRKSKKTVLVLQDLFFPEKVKQIYQEFVQENEPIPEVLENRMKEVVAEEKRLIEIPKVILETNKLIQSQRDEQPVSKLVLEDFDVKQLNELAEKCSGEKRRGRTREYHLVIAYLRKCEDRKLYELAKEIGMIQ